MDAGSRVGAVATETHLDLAVALLQLQRPAEAEAQARAAIRPIQRPHVPNDFLGQLLAQGNHLDLAHAELRLPCAPTGTTVPRCWTLRRLMMGGDASAAVPLLEEAQRSPQKAVAEAARGMLGEMSPRI